MVRKPELLRTRWEHVDFEQAEWHISAEHTKTGKPHIVFLSRAEARRAVTNALRRTAIEGRMVLNFTYDINGNQVQAIEG